jgi:predicted nuclease of predicted toxin-antitoxin system
MRIVVDECIDERLRLLFPDHDCQTARFAKLAGLKNGRLLDAAEAAGFNVLLTVDRNIPDQQNFAGRSISVVILCAPTLRSPLTVLRDLELLVPAVGVALASIRPGEIVKIR